MDRVSAVHHRFRVCIVLLCVQLFCPGAYAAAWTLEEGTAQLMAETTWSFAHHSFADDGALSFRKLFIKDDYEYGLSDGLTVFSMPEYVSASVRRASGITEAREFSYAGGIRQRLYEGAGIASVQLTYTRTTAFTMTVADGQAAGHEAEIRLLYGRGLRVSGLNVFVDAEAGWRWNTRPRPNEVVADITAGVWLRNDLLLYGQSFMVFSAGYGEYPYTFYWQHKLALNLSWRVTDRLSLQAGGFLSPAGRHVVAERGLSVSVWYNLLQDVPPDFHF